MGHYVSRSEARTVACPDCGAEPSAKCRGANGRARDSVHRGRMNLIADQTGAYRTHTLTLDGGTLRDEDGNTVGRVTSVELDFQGEVGGNLRRGVEGDAVQAVLSQESRSHQRGVRGEGEQTALLSDPVSEVWEHYTLTLERPKAVLTPKVRRWISDAIEEVGVDRCKLAISGLAASEHHRHGGYVGIEYALRPKTNQTIESRVSMMEAKAPSSNAGTTVAELLATVPSEGRDIVRSRMTDVVRMFQAPDHAGAQTVGEQSLRKLREAVPHVEPVVVDGVVTGWKRVTA